MEYNHPSEIVKDVNFGEKARSSKQNKPNYWDYNIGKDPKPSY